MSKNVSVFVPKKEKTDVISIRVPASVKKRWDALIKAMDNPAVDGDLRETAKDALLDLIERWETALEKALSNGKKETHV